nr:hypothetical protein StreXyl84_58820 [Streptomyces sp. Xyl84]
MVVVIAALLGVVTTWNPLRLLGVTAAVLLGPAFFSCLSMTIAGIVLGRDRLMGIGQAITMPLFFGSDALYPVAVMPGLLQAVSRADPLSYQVDVLRGPLLGPPGTSRPTSPCSSGPPRPASPRPPCSSAGRPGDGRPPGRRRSDLRHARCGRSGRPSGDFSSARLDHRSMRGNSLATAHSAHLTVHSAHR